MSDYVAYGSGLRSDIDFPELPTAGADVSPRWTLRTATRAAPAGDLACLGEEKVVGTTRVRCFARGGGYRLAFDDTGIFDISPDGAELVWYPGPQATADACRMDVIGRVLAMALFASGTLCLHGSAVAADQRGLTFLAPKFHGKSTLALAMTRAGWRLVTDDTIPVDPGPPPRLAPGLPTLRLWPDSARHLAGIDGPTEPGVKHVLPDRSAAPGTPDPLLSTIYLLAPIGQGGPAVGRTRLSGVGAALAIVRHAKLGPLLRGAAAGRLFAQAAALATNVPVFQLEVVRDFARLPDVVEQLCGWHGLSGHRQAI